MAFSIYWLFFRLEEQNFCESPFQFQIEKAKRGTRGRSPLPGTMRKSGLKFGLIGSASSLKKEGGKAKPIGSKPPPRRRPAGATAVFDVDSDEDRGPQEDPRGVAAVNKRLSAISAKQERQAKKDFEDALQADPSVFDYDGVYDGMKNR